MTFFKRRPEKAATNDELTPRFQALWADLIDPRTKSLAEINNLRDRTWDLQKELKVALALAADTDMRGPAYGLLLTSLYCIEFETIAEHWHRVLSAADGLSLAVTAFIAEASRRHLKIPDEFVQPMQARVEDAIYAAHRAPDLDHAPVVIETLTSILMGYRLIQRWVNAEGRRPSAYVGVEQAARKISLAHGLPPAVPASEIQKLLAAEREFSLEEALQGEREGLNVYSLLGPGTYLPYAQHHSSRTAILIASGRTGGCAIRYPYDSGVADSIELPGADSETIESMVEQVQGIFEQGSSAPEVEIALRNSLEAVGDIVWAPILEAWPNLIEGRVALIPLGQTAGLPLFGAVVNGSPICGQVDLSLVPSPQTFAWSAARQAPGGEDVLVVADEWFGDDAIPYVTAEARAIAAVHGVEPELLRSGTAPRGATEPSSGRSRVRRMRSTVRWPGTSVGADSQALASQLSRASVVHLACHGSYDPMRPLETALFLGAERTLGDLLALDLHGNPLIVLSGCELASVGRIAPGEQVGFPNALLTMGARGVVSALWPVPDEEDTVRLMVSLHERLRWEGASAALGAAIAEASQEGTPASVWGSFAYFGA